MSNFGWTRRGFGWTIDSWTDVLVLIAVLAIIALLAYLLVRKK